MATTYPELLDALSTSSRPMINGLRSGLVFIEHSHCEDFHLTEIERATMKLAILSPLFGTIHARQPYGIDAVSWSASEY